MKRRFVVCTDQADKENQNILTTFFRDQRRLGYWHWFNDSWLITDPDQNWTATSLRQQISSLLPNTNVIVIQMDGDNTWSGRGNAKMFKWLRETW